MVTVDEGKVAALLAESIEVHKAACTARQKKQGDAVALLIKARDLRLEAHALDPECTAVAWKGEQSQTQPGKDTHQAVMNFYAQKIGL